MPDFQSAAGEYTSIRSGTRNVGSTIDGGSDPRELFLKLYAGEVMTAFQTRNVMMPLGRVRTISKGKEAQFIMTGKYRDAAYHTPGNRIAPDANAKHSERLVTIDDLLINAQFIPRIDEAIQHYDVRNVYTQEAGYGLSKVADQNILRVLTKAALATNVERASKLINNYKTFDQEDFSANVTIGASGGDARKPKFIVKAIMDARRELEKIGAPLDGLVCIMSTDSFYDLFDSTASGTTATDLAVFNRDFGGTGSIGGMQLPTIAGIPVVTTPHFGSYNAAGDWSNSIFSDLSTAGATGQRSTGPTPISTESGRDKAYDITNNEDADYAASASAGSTVGADGGTDADAASVDLKDETAKIRFFVMSKDAVATVKLMDLAVESEYQIDRQGTLIVSKYAMGHDVLRPAMAVACLSTSATA